MKQGIVGLIMGVVVGTVLASGAAFALTVPNHAVSSLGTAVASTVGDSTHLASMAALRSVTASGSVGGAMHQGDSSAEVAHAKHAANHATRRTDSTAGSSSATQHSATHDVVDHTHDADAVHDGAEVHSGHTGNDAHGACD